MANDINNPVDTTNLKLDLYRGEKDDFSAIENSSPEEVDEEVKEDDDDFEEDLEDEDALEDIPVDFIGALSKSQNQSSTSLSRKLSRNDANSIVGGDAVVSSYAKKKHPIADSQRPTQDQERVIGNTPFSDDEIDAESVRAQSQKIFSFSLPFGGLTSFSSSLYKQITSLRLDSIHSIPLIDSLPIIGNNHDDNSSDEKQQMKLRLERQQSIGTLEDAEYFRKFKGTDDVRFRAVKHTLTSTLIPDFMQSKKDEETYESIYNDIEGNIVILGGYRGSILRDRKTGKRLWIPIKAGFNLRKINLLLGPTKEDEIRAVDCIYPDGVLKNIGPIDICKKFIKKLASNPKTNVKEFGYDWRLSGSIVSKQLEKFLLDIYEGTGKPTIVIAHSMGGLMAHGALQRNPKLFRSLIYVGVPSECLNILGPIRFGDSVIFSDKILTYETNFMMRSSFNFLPLSGRVFYNIEKNEWYDLDYFDPETWVEYNLNPLVCKERRILEESVVNSSRSTMIANSDSTFSINLIGNKLRNYRALSLTRRSKTTSLDEASNQSSEFTLPERSTSPSLFSMKSNEDNEIVRSYSFSFSDAYNYLKETLKLTKEYILSLDYREELEPEYPPLAMVYGNTVPSVRGSIVRGLDDIREGNYYEFFYGHGDGVVHQKWLMPERKGFSFYNNTTGQGDIVCKVASDCGHVNLMTDFKAMGKALYAVTQAEMFWDQKQERLRQMRKSGLN